MKTSLIILLVIVVVAILSIIFYKRQQDKTEYTGTDDIITDPAVGSTQDPTLLSWVNTLIPLFQSGLEYFGTRENGYEENGNETDENNS